MNNYSVQIQSGPVRSEHPPQAPEIAYPIPSVPRRETEEDMYLEAIMFSSVEYLRAIEKADEFDYNSTLHCCPQTLQLPLWCCGGFGGSVF